MSLFRDEREFLRLFMACLCVSLLFQDVIRLTKDGTTCCKTNHNIIKNAMTQICCLIFFSIHARAFEKISIE